MVSAPYERKNKKLENIAVRAVKAYISKSILPTYGRFSRGPSHIDILIIIINFPYSTCIRSFFGSSILTSLFIFKCFFVLVSVIFLQYIANVTHRTFEIFKKIEIPRI